MNTPIHFYLTVILILILIRLSFSLEQNFISKKLAKANVECGFENMSKRAFKFSNQFFIISIVFLIFDIELIILMPIPIFQFSTCNLILLITIIILLAFRTIIEWLSGVIEWAKSQTKLY